MISYHLICCNLIFIIVAASCKSFQYQTRRANNYQPSDSAHSLQSYPTKSLFNCQDAADQTRKMPWIVLINFIWYKYPSAQAVLSQFKQPSEVLRSIYFISLETNFQLWTLLAYINTQDLVTILLLMLFLISCTDGCWKSISNISI